jgi:hypothetical protein
MRQTTHEHIRELGRRWVAAELKGDLDALTSKPSSWSARWARAHAN